MGYPIDSKEGREAMDRAGWGKIPAVEWIEALEALKNYKIPDRFLKKKDSQQTQDQMEVSNEQSVSDSQFS